MSSESKGKQRALLALLLVNANRTLAIERIVDELWGERAPESASKMVQVYVSQLRKLLPDGLLLTRPPGYALELEPEQLDLRRFERLLAEGREALSEGSAERAAARLAEALALWRGPALAEFVSEPFGSPRERTWRTSVLPHSRSESRRTSPAAARPTSPLSVSSRAQGGWQGSPRSSRRVTERWPPAPYGDPYGGRGSEPVALLVRSDGERGIDRPDAEHRFRAREQQS